MPKQVGLCGDVVPSELPRLQSVWQAVGKKKDELYTWDEAHRPLAGTWLKLEFAKARAIVFSYIEQDWLTGVVQVAATPICLK